MTRRVEPYDPHCNRYASDMPELDYLWSDGPFPLEDDEDTKQWERINYIQIKAGYDYEPATGKFRCDLCYRKQTSGYR